MFASAIYCCVVSSVSRMPSRGRNTTGSKEVTSNGIAWDKSLVMSSVIKRNNYQSLKIK